MRRQLQKRTAGPSHIREGRGWIRDDSAEARAKKRRGEPRRNKAVARHRTPYFAAALRRWWHDKRRAASATPNTAGETPALHSETAEHYGRWAARRTAPRLCSGRLTACRDPGEEAFEVGAFAPEEGEEFAGVELGCFTAEESFEAPRPRALKRNWPRFFELQFFPMERGFQLALMTSGVFVRVSAIKVPHLRRS